MPAEATQNTEVDPNAKAPGEQANDTSATDKAALGGEQGAPQGEEKVGESAAPKTPLEAAKRVMAKEQKTGSEQKSQTESQSTKPDDKVLKAESDDEKLPFKDHPRWREMSSENRILKVAKEKNEEAIKALEPRARTLDDLSNFLSQNNLGKEDFQSALSIMQAVRNDPAKALELLQPIVGELENLVGVRLPPELQAKVDSGELTAEHALELSRARGGERLARSKAESYEQRNAREAEDRRTGDEKAQLDAVVNAINAAEQEWTKRDPDAAKLRPLLEDRLLAAGGMNPPRNPEEARKLFDECLAHVKKQAAGFVPPPREKTGVLPAGGATTTAAPVAKSSLDAARAALSMGQ